MEIEQDRERWSIPHEVGRSKSKNSGRVREATERRSKESQKGKLKCLFKPFPTKVWILIKLNDGDDSDSGKRYV